MIPEELNGEGGVVVRVGAEKVKGCSFRI